MQGEGLVLGQGVVLLTSYLEGVLLTSRTLAACPEPIADGLCLLCASFPHEAGCPWLMSRELASPGRIIRKEQPHDTHNPG